MVLIALSFQGEVEKYGAYVGIAAFFGLAVLSLLYFSQARELKRLREWAGRAPERAREMEQRIVAQAAARATRPSLPTQGGIVPPRRLAEMPDSPAGAAQTAAGAQATEVADRVEGEEAATNGSKPGAPGAPPAAIGANGAAPPVESVEGESGEGEVGEDPAAKAHGDEHAAGDSTAASEREGAESEGQVRKASAEGAQTEGKLAASDGGAAAPEGGAGEPQVHPAVPRGQSAVSEGDTAAPQRETVVPQGRTAALQGQTADRLDSEPQPAPGADQAAEHDAQPAGAGQDAAGRGAQPAGAGQDAAGRGAQPAAAGQDAAGRGAQPVAAGQDAAGPEAQPAAEPESQSQRTVAARPGEVPVAVPRATPAQRVGVTPRPPAALPLRQTSPSATPASDRGGGGLRRPGTPARRPTPAPRERRSIGTIALFVGVAVLILGGGAFVVSQLGGDDTPPAPNRAAPPPAQTESGGGARKPPAETNVAVLNGTTFTGLAGDLADTVTAEGYERGIVETNTRDQTIQDSIVYYAEGDRPAARAIARTLSIDNVEPIDAETQSLAPDADVVVLAGADQAP